ncbi:MAG: alpha/beta fold hydrolase [Saprospiraceae bacterium]
MKKIFTLTGVILWRILVFFAIAITILPIALLPASTSIPFWIQILFMMVDAALLIAVFRLGFTLPVILAELAGFVLIAIMAIYASQIFASTPPIVDANGKPIPHSIAVLEKVKLGDAEEWISIRGKDSRNPVLLYLAGGPGGSELVSVRRALGGLEDHFVVVNWEQPGSGKSFNSVNRSLLTPERYITDTHELILKLRLRFEKEKVYLLGGSWGSALGIMVVQRHPELFHAFIGTGQMVAFLDNDLICYNLDLRLAQESGDIQQREKLKQQGPPPYYGKNALLKSGTFLMDLNKYMDKNPAIVNPGYSTFQDLAGSEYGLYDKVNFWRGLLSTGNIVYQQLWKVDFRKQAKYLEVPVYFLIGRHDLNAPPKLTEEYFDILSAPHKELIWFEQSGHVPWVNEPAKFMDVMVNQILKKI